MLDAIGQIVEGSLLLVLYVTLCLGAAAWFIVSALFGGDMDAEIDDAGDLLSLRNVLLFCMGFGGAGAIAVSLRASLWVSVAAGVAGGLAVAATGVVFFRVLRGQEATTGFNSDLLVGSTGTVTHEVRHGVTGEISTRDNRGQQVRLSAIPSKNTVEPITAGTPVAIQAMHGGTAVVAPIED